MGARRRAVLLGGLACGLLLSASALAGVAPPAPAAGAAGATLVATTTMTFVDNARSTPPWNGAAAQPSRTLVTTIWFPARSGSASASPHGPYPLIVFGHGLGGAPQDYTELLNAWAAAGYVVAAPLFPLSSSQTPGGPDGGDIGNQPGDMSFVIDQVLKASAAAHGPLSGLVDPKEIGAAGHSNGAITTLGLVANSCCRDTRVKAAVVMAGTTEGLGRGQYHLAEAPPLLIVQDLHDGLVPYGDAVAVFNQARGPKALLALDWDVPSDPTGSTAHMAASGVVGPTSSAVIRSTTAFFNSFLKHQQGALQAVAADGRSSQSVVHTAWAQGSRTTLPVPKTAAVHLHASVSPDSGLHDGQGVTVRWRGYTPGKVVNILECSHVEISTASSSGCSFAHADILHADPTGSGSAVLHVGTGTIGDGVCDAAHTCYVVVNNASSTDPADTKEVAIRFAA
ncbi:MAG TPA: neocarzinostatin apoprotein domain-containing protein [Acidimicrobiales bacterium]|nr:neocarzinostatin apoprotein domain-containing protein [Acidimicrobiales bacterium]